jgi:anti-sigma factor ChrR (cupin superfamily)
MDQERNPPPRPRNLERYARYLVLAVSVVNTRRRLTLVLDVDDTDERATKPQVRAEFFLFNQLWIVQNVERF